ncbi:acetyltransferase [Aquimarina sp. AU58]|uniref:acetyltransferase n=1 Tax=Aquimarina sp. AU58 TaxID=1874112 RepID=UPI000D6E8CDB|nr:acetyltransferase [Aquimarina sp. AU58]
MKSIVIVGTGDYAEMAYQYLKRDNYNKVIAFSVEKKFKTVNKFCDLPVVDFEEITNFFPAQTHELLIAIGPNKVNTVRERLYLEAKDLGYDFVTYISPRANIWDLRMVGENSFIFDGCVIEPGAKIGVNTVLWSGTVVAHHSTIGDHCFLAPSVAVSGKITIKNNCFIGINATIRDHVTIEEHCIIGCGAVIKKNTIKNGVYSTKGTDLLRVDSIETQI